jgi:hypothetical protein
MVFNCVISLYSTRFEEPQIKEEIYSIMQNNKHADMVSFIKKYSEKVISIKKNINKNSSFIY